VSAQVKVLEQVLALAVKQAGWRNLDCSLLLLRIYAELGG